MTDAGRRARGWHQPPRETDALPRVRFRPDHDFNPAYSPSVLLRRRQAPHLRRFARSRILAGQASTPPVRSVAKHPIYGT